MMTATAQQGFFFFHLVLKCDTSIIYYLMYSFLLLLFALNWTWNINKGQMSWWMSSGLSIQRVSQVMLSSIAGHFHDLTNGIFRIHPKCDTFSTFVYPMVTLMRMYSKQVTDITLQVFWVYSSPLIIIPLSTAAILAAKVRSCHMHL